MNVRDAIFINHLKKVLLGDSYDEENDIIINSEAHNYKELSKE